MILDFDGNVNAINSTIVTIVPNRTMTGQTDSVVDIVVTLGAAASAGFWASRPVKVRIEG